MSNRKRIDLKPHLAFAAVVGIFVLTLALVTAPADISGVKDVLLILVGALVGIVKDVFGYYFGSSEGSARKTELLTFTDLVPPADQAGPEVQP